MNTIQVSNEKSMLSPNTKSTLDKFRIMEIGNQKLIKGGATSQPIEEGTATDSIIWI